MTDDNQSKLGRTLLKGLVELKEQKGNLALQDVGAMFVQMASTINSHLAKPDDFMQQEISRLAHYIDDAKKEIFGIATNDKSETVINDASQHLDEVIKATEQATNNIMDAADIIQNNVAGIGGEKEKNISNAASAIFNACTFQDLSGQRITKVIKLLENIDERIRKLNNLFGTQASQGGNGSAPLTEKDLLNGPQLAKDASSQADIDALFNSLGGKA